ncbi:(p)ppGpp synthetase [Taibaiella sp. KBW10]|uniref:RelA/SpoT domain-containing protein n=1 Tax=Taibaiella sp. KBW10 TaxID=2153357 RepID=UPI000F5A866F|nr:RelA/SpoT domain-containing protein [Taibaiella sp. KBW10]RQO30975.1 (p)ppGpp synthetase [Taibaiella sp. KBW10]
MAKQIPIKLLKHIDSLVAHFVDNKNTFRVLEVGLNTMIGESIGLRDLMHSYKSRIKDPSHLKDKLLRKANELKKGETFDYTLDDLFEKINDLVGFRILHLHTSQFEAINIELKKILAEHKWQIIEGPNARTWDDETRAYFTSIGVETSPHPNMYTSVHYILKSNNSNPITCEIQVRTLMEEVWGEVDHKINYPHKSNSHSCREQIKTLARVTSSCSRLVDSIFSTYNYEHKKQDDIKVQPIKKITRKKD